MWGRQEHIFLKGYLGVVSLGKACRWRGEEEGGGTSLPLPCTLALGNGTHSDSLSTSSSTAEDTSASESNGVREGRRANKGPCQEPGSIGWIQSPSRGSLKRGKWGLTWQVVKRWGETRLSICLSHWRLPRYSRPGAQGTPLALGSSWSLLSRRTVLASSVQGSSACS